MTAWAMRCLVLLVCPLMLRVCPSSRLLVLPEAASIKTNLDATRDVWCGTANK